MIQLLKCLCPYYVHIFGHRVQVIYSVHLLEAGR